MKDKNETYSYLGGLMHGIGSLLTGMKTTMTVFCRRKVTEQFSGLCLPDNRYGNIACFPAIGRGMNRRIFFYNQQINLQRFRI